MGKSNEYTSRGYLYIKGYSPYVDGVVGADIQLSFRQKLKILFAKGVCACIGNVFKKEEK